MKLRAIVFALALAACGQSAEKAEPPAAAQGPDAADLHIQIGRAGAMLSSVESLTGERSGNTETPATDPAELARGLRETVWRYNIARSELCAKGLFSEVACGPAYEPVWISEPNTVRPTLEEIQARTGALHEEVERLWGAVCDDARSRVAGEQEKMAVCPME
jgi:hypothetical protein